MNTWKPKMHSNELHVNPRIQYFSKLFNVHPLLIQYIWEKNIQKTEEISDYLFPSVSHFHNPFLLNDMKKAIKRIIYALKQKEPIVIFGDYDVDGMTSSSLLAKGLRFFGGNVNVELPLRRDGYGLSESFVEKAKIVYDAKLIITVDNGTSAHSAIEKAKSLGIDCIITDHHEIMQGEPSCYAFINPKRTDNTYPFPYLCGAGVALKIVHSLFLACNRPWSEYMWEYIELACIGTIADMVPLTGENRVIAKLGLQKLQRQPSSFFQELSSLLYVSQITSDDIAFRVGPILNSSGRIDNPNNVVDILLSKNVSRSSVQSLIEIDKKRKQITEFQYKQAVFQVGVSLLHEKPIIVLHGDFDDGLIGIISAKITEKYGKPSIIISKNGKASCRVGKNANFSMVDAIEQCQSLLKGFGGHRAAAGFSIKEEKIPEFQMMIEKVVGHTAIEKPVAYYDQLMDIQNLSHPLLDDLSLLEPFGMGNAKPIFFSPNTPIDSIQYFGLERQFFKCHSNSIELLSFKQAEKMRDYENHGFLNLLYTIQKKDSFLIEDFSIDSIDSMEQHSTKAI